MSSQRYSPEFKDEAVRQIIERSYSVAEVSERLGVSSHSLYKWVKAVKQDKTEEHAAELVEALGAPLRQRAVVLPDPLVDRLQRLESRPKRGGMDTDYLAHEVVDGHKHRGHARFVPDADL